jgi:transposase
MTRDTINQVRSLLISAPAAMREALLKVKPQACIAACAELRSPPDGSASGSLEASLRLLAKRWLALTEELRELDGALDRLTQRAAPRLLSRFGVGSQTAATLLITAGDNPDRLRSEAALAALCGASPLEASSGKVTRHRLNRGGSRQANNALWTIAIVRMRGDQRTRAYVERRTREGRSSKEIQRCLKRYIVREFYPLIIADFRAAATNS